MVQVFSSVINELLSHRHKVGGTFYLTKERYRPVTTTELEGNRVESVHDYNNRWWKLNHVRREMRVCGQ